MSFITDYLGEIIVLVLSAVLAFAFEKWFPTTDTAQKHFWAAMSFIFSAVLGLSINSTFKMNHKMDRLSQAVQEHAELSKHEAGIHVVAGDYDNIIEKASGTLKKWGEDSLRSLDKDLKEGYIPIGRASAADTIAQVYYDANHNILASNVGSIDFYFDIKAYAYKRANLYARDKKQVPIIRFFIYSAKSSRDIHLTNSCVTKGLKPERIGDFSQCVRELNGELGSLCSVVVDFDKYSKQIGEAEDLLLVDNSFVARTMLDQEDWEPTKAKATEAIINPEAAEDARRFFRKLWVVTGDTCTGWMPDDKIPNYFPQFNSLKPKQNQHLADAAFHQLMEQVTGPQ